MADDLNTQNNENIEISSDDFTVGNIINNSFSIGLANIGPIVLVLLVYYLTIWIPYINLGTSIATIAMAISIARNESFTVEALFSHKYRKLIGPMFLLWGISLVAILLGFLFLIIPGLILAMAWSLAPYLIIDKNLDVMDALKVSYKITYGKKGILFLSAILLSLIQNIGNVIVSTIVWAPQIMVIGVIGEALFLIVFTAIWVGFMGYVYNQLSRDI
jgi:hypothetical protein|tara:strand:+ start:225 stop:875 length:651 start_codon:yes stop_codon:yes gene_type:complete